MANSAKTAFFTVTVVIVIIAFVFTFTFAFNPTVLFLRTFRFCQSCAAGTVTINSCYPVPAAPASKRRSGRGFIKMNLKFKLKVRLLFRFGFT
jgi:hypothetical protein